MVARIVNDELGWLFRAVPQEVDVGIDGYLDVVTPDGEVTGRQIAVQIKCGKSFLKPRNKPYWLFRGELRHLNYFFNLPCPVIVVICDPANEECWWALVRLEDTEEAKNGWVLPVPKTNKLNADARLPLESLVDAVDDVTDDLRHYWDVNRMVGERDAIIYVAARDDVESRSVENALGFFDRLLSTDRFATENRGKVWLTIWGYDDDSRELWEIPEVRDWITSLDRAIDSWFWHLSSRREVAGLLLVFLCQTAVQRIEGGYVEYNPRELAKFMESEFLRLNAMAERYELPETELKTVSLAVIDYYTQED